MHRDNDGVLELMTGALVLSSGEQPNHGVVNTNTYLTVACMRYCASPVNGMDASGFRRPDRMPFGHYVGIAEPQALLCLATGRLEAKLPSGSRVFPAFNVFGIA